MQALDKRAQQLGTHAEALDIVVNFTIDGPNAQGVNQKPCVNCGNCVTGCNVGAKNTLYMNYLPMAAKAGAAILTQTNVEWLEKLAAGEQDSTFKTQLLDQAAAYRKLAAKRAMDYGLPAPSLPEEPPRP